jgi:hypothetical protein
MADPDNDNPTPGKSAEDLLAELATVRGDLTRERESLRAEREAVGQLRDAVVGMAGQYSQPQAQPEPDEPLPGDDEFDNDRVGSTARVSAAVVKRALTSYDGSIRGEIQELRAAQLDTEWERVKTEDPKNFARLERGMREFFNRNEYSPGMVKNVFYRMRGEYMPKLLELDRAEREREPVATPNSAAPARKSTATFDTLDPHEIATIRGLNVTPESYFGLKHERQPKFEKGYLASVGLPEATAK